MGAPHIRDLRTHLEANSIPEPNSGCWLWLGYCNPKGYGVVGYQKRTRKVHRLSWTVYRGPIPDGLHVLHKCDVRCCINPDHLWLGTNDDNVADAMRKNRNTKLPGEMNPNAKLTADMVRSIRQSVGSSDAVAAQFGIDGSNVRGIRSGKFWRHL